jgi:hypothetical protein
MGFANNSEIYVASVAPRPAFESGTIMDTTQIAPGSIVIFAVAHSHFAPESASEGG